MPRRNLVVIGASAGGLSVVAKILADLPPSVPAAVVVVIHTGSNGTALSRILARRARRDVETATDAAPLAPGRIYVAPADRHVLIGPDGLRVVRGPRENGFRPAIDPLFRSAARIAGPAAIGVVLSGALDDGSYGLSAIVRRGGAAIVQDPQDAEVPSMPLAAMREAPDALVLPAPAIAGAIARLCGESVQEATTPMPRRDQPEPQQPDDDTHVADMERLLGPPSPITCPACGGALWETQEDGVVRYACHVGHQYAPDSLLAAHNENVEQALWSAVRVLEQHAELRMRMAARADAAGMPMVANSFQEDSHEYHRQAMEIRRLVFGDRDAQPADEALRRKAQAAEAAPRKARARQTR